MIDPCSDTETLDGYVSGELDAKAAARVASHVAGCRRCAEDVAARAALRRELAEVLGGEDVDGMRVLNDPLRRRVVTAMEATDAASSGGSWRAVVPLAAAVVIAAMAGWWSARVVGDVSSESSAALTLVDQAAYADALVNHLACGVMRSFPEGSTEAESRKRLGHYAAILETVAGSSELELVHAHVCPNRGRRFGHLVLRLQGETVSVLVTDKSEGAALPRADRIPTGSAIVGVVDFPTLELAGLETPSLMGFIATPKRGLESRAVAELATELNRAMRAIEGNAGPTFKREPERSAQ